MRRTHHCARAHVKWHVHQRAGTTPAVAQGIADHVWSIGELIDAALATQPEAPVVTAPQRRKLFEVIEGGKA